MKGKEIYLKVKKFKPKTKNCEQIKKQTIIDVRSEKEYENHHIPNSLSIPLIHSKEHHEVGYLYTQVSPEVAYDLGFNYIYKNLDEILKKAKKLEGEILIYCSRGGLRSKTVTMLFQEIGLKVFQLKGGMKAYRNFIKYKFENYNYPKLIMIAGLAGVGKTKYLEKLSSIDLEKCANHSSSTYGALDHEPNTQKQFLFNLYENIERVKNNKQVFIECESRKVGSLEIPSPLWKAMCRAERILLEAPIKQRAKHLTKEYPSMKKYVYEYIKQTETLNKYLSKKIMNQLIEYIKENKPDKFWELILKEHYDNTYKHFFKHMKFKKTINAEHFKETLKELKINS